MTMENNPRVRIFIGRVSMLSSGLRNAFKIPKTSATTIATQYDSIPTPGIRYAARYTANAAMMRCKMMRIGI